METITVEFDSALFTAEAVLLAAHRFTGEWTVEVVTDTGCMRICIDHAPGADTAALTRALRNAVLDEQVRATVREKTAPVHNILVNAALNGARPR